MRLTKLKTAILHALRSTNGINFYYEERGSGDPLFLIMGITAPGSVWEKHASYWEDQFRCIIPDNRGVGLVDKPEGPYTSEAMADDYAGLLEALAISSVRVVGVSMGSIIAQQLALRHPEKVRVNGADVPLGALRPARGGGV